MPTSGHALFEDLINITVEDVIIVFGFSGVLPEQKVIFDHINMVGASSILISDVFVSELIEQSDIVLYVERGEIWEFHSMITPLLLIEAIVASVALEKEGCLRLVR